MYEQEILKPISEMEYKLEDAHTAVLNTLKEKYDIRAIENPFSYIKNIQSEFDYSRIKYPAEYYGA